MKEHEPGLTVRQAKEILEKEGIRISVKGIWGIWKRHGYAGFNRENMVSNFTDCPWTEEAKTNYELAKRLFEQNAVDRSAKILNSIPTLPENEILHQIPDSLLNTRRQIEKMGLLFGKIPVRSYLERLRNLFEECRSRNLNYSIFIVGLLEIKALSWSGEPSEMLKKVKNLREILERSGNLHTKTLITPRLSLLISEGFAHTGLLKTKAASDIARTCRALLRKRKHVSPFFLRDLGQLYAQLEDFREAKYWYLKSKGQLSGEEEKITKSFLTDISIVKGDYKRALEIWKNEEVDHWGNRSKMLRIRAMWSLNKGMPHRAISLATQVLASLEKEEAKGSIFGCYLTIAGAYCSLGENTRARRILEGLLPFIEKNQLEILKTIIEILISHEPTDGDSITSDKQAMPTVKLALLLRNGQYAKAVKHAEDKGITGFLQRYIFFFPEVITDLLEKGKPTNLPRTMLNLPVFRKEIPVYSVNFLGRLIVIRNQQYQRIKLAPKDAAFLIHLATAKTRRIALDRIYENFWPDSKNPSRNLAHLLVRLRKALCLPSHFLYIKENSLSFDCHFITDYNEYQEHLARAKAFSIAGEWAFARTEYLHAFSLFRDAPFKKMYDDWSENMRNTILGNLENETMKYAEACSAHGEREKGIEVLQKIARIIPLSDEMENIMHV